MKKRDIVVGLVVIVLFFVFYNRYYKSQNKPEPISEETPIASFEEDIEKTLGVQIDDDVQKLEISSGNNRAIVTRDDTGQINILADLEKIEPDQKYQVWEIEGDKATSLGILESKKGGFLLRTSSDSLNKIIISRETIIDEKIESRILEGSF